MTYVSIQKCARFRALATLTHCSIVVFLTRGHHPAAPSSPSSSLSSPSMNASDIFAFFCIEIVVPLLTLGVPPTLLNVPGSPIVNRFGASVMCGDSRDDICGCRRASLECPL